MSPPFPPSPCLPEPIQLLEERIDAVVGPLLPGELEATERMVPKRLREFTAGRVLARQACVALGFASVPIPVAPDRRPLWPSGVVGSISHTDEHVGVAVGPGATLRGIGLDLEKAEDLPPETIPLVATAGEQRHVATWPADERGLIYKRLFSAKEAVFKCTYPQTGLWLDFLDVELELSAALDTFRVHIRQSEAAIACPTGWIGAIQTSPRLIRSTLVWPRS